MSDYHDGEAFQASYDEAEIRRLRKVNKNLIAALRVAQSEAYNKNMTWLFEFCERVLKDVNNV